MAILRQNSKVLGVMKKQQLIILSLFQKLPNFENFIEVMFSVSFIHLSQK